ncbi:hypothetical protein DPMN_056377 [Dreissena polymorpha]|uniref:Uncharacterized protein n=1 Tax=Dreissena polymorpha TaxID=45954 RepID=A0A9D4HV01_DREPO|nr:hypothetical protein DPMN_056377 [Dreissena polymorpha]
MHMSGHNCTPIVYETFDFSYWQLFMPLKGLFQYNKIAFGSTDTGFATCIELGLVEETKFNLLIKCVSVNEVLKLPLPVTISGAGFSAE